MASPRSSNPLATSSQAHLQQENIPSGGEQSGKRRKRKNKKRKNRRQSFIAPNELPEHVGRPSLRDTTAHSSNTRDSIYMLGRGNQSRESLDSEALLDHRDHGPLQARRQSIQQGGWHNASQPRFSSSRPSEQPTPQLGRSATLPAFDVPENDDADASTPLLSSSAYRQKRNSPRGGGSGYQATASGRLGPTWRHPRSRDSSKSSHRRRSVADLPRNSSRDILDTPLGYDVNNPPSVPGSPTFGPGFGMPGGPMGDEAFNLNGDAFIDIDTPSENNGWGSASPTSQGPMRRKTFAAEEDVCFPQDILSEIAEEEDLRSQQPEHSPRPRRRRRPQWPDLSVLDEWSAVENEESQREMTGDARTRQVAEPLMVGGRLRPRKVDWHREIEDAPYRFTYFNQDFESTIHSQTIAELLQPGQTFRHLFVPEAPILDDSESSEDEDDMSKTLLGNLDRKVFSNTPSQAPSVAQSDAGRSSAGRQFSTATATSTETATERGTPVPPSSSPQANGLRYGSRPVFWLDVLSPTEAELRVLSKAFAIHPLTTEDIMMQEEREKVELFRHYYFVTYRSFEQDIHNEEYLEPVNMYVVVFKEGVISFHFSQTPHPANVRRRIRQLSDYLSVNTDWISYAIIDDVTDAYAPLIERIEEEVDDIDQLILDMHKHNFDEDESPDNGKSLKEILFGGLMGSSRKSEGYTSLSEKNPSGGNTQKHHTDMLRRVGDCRRKVMSLYRLLGTKADALKGFAKRCNEQWEVAPRSEIGLYLGDIQDHIVTMTGNLGHYENILSRAHSNYLAQMNIGMTERAEKTNDVLGKLTVLGTIVLPLNIVTGLWGMNVRVPGEEGEPGDMAWFMGITGSLVLFGLICFIIARKFFAIV